MEKEKFETIADIEGKKRSKTIAIIIGLAGGAIVLSFLYTIVSMFTMPSSQNLNKVVKKEAIPREEVEKSWKTHFERRLTGQSEKIRKIEDRVEKLEEGQKEISKKLDAIISNLKQFQEKQTALERQVEETKKEVKVVSKKPPIAPPITSKEKVKETTKPYPEEEKANKFYEETHIKEGKEEKKTIKVFKPKKVSKKEKEKDKILRIPMGFAKGITLSGSDFPTLQYGRNNPHPIFISLASKEILANNKKLNLKECFIIGSGWGELSSERAYILLDKISCNTKDGRLLEAQVKGWIMDDDGKVGLRGRLVTKQGAYLGKSVIAGFLSGISRILSASATTVQISPVGTTSTIKPEDALKVGMYSGIGSATERLAKFYEKMAEEIFPVIEVNGGRRVVIAFDTNGAIRLSEKKLELNPLKSSKEYELGSIKFKNQASGGKK